MSKDSRTLSDISSGRSLLIMIDWTPDTISTHGEDAS
jgi:hypothetical protein